MYVVVERKKKKYENRLGLPQGMDEISSLIFFLAFLQKQISSLGTSIDKACLIFRSSVAEIQ
jgi:hypothetical protein